MSGINQQSNVAWAGSLSLAVALALGGGIAPKTAKAADECGYGAVPTSTAFSATAMYSAGDLVISGGVTYSASAAIDGSMDAPGSAGSSWTQVEVAGQSNMRFAEFADTETYIEDDIVRFTVGSVERLYRRIGTGAGDPGGSDGNMAANGWSSPIPLSDFARTQIICDSSDSASSVPPYDTTIEYDDADLAIVYDRGTEAIQAESITHTGAGGEIRINSGTISRSTNGTMISLNGGSSSTDTLRVIVSDGASLEQTVSAAGISDIGIFVQSGAAAPIEITARGAGSISAGGAAVGAISIGGDITFRLGKNTRSGSVNFMQMEGDSEGIISIEGGSHINTTALSPVFLFYSLQSRLGASNDWTGRALFSVASGATVGESGTITALRLRNNNNLDADNPNLITNAGTIYGAISVSLQVADAEVLVGDSIERFVNSGSFTGSVDLLGGDDVVINSGMMTFIEHSDFGTGDDSLTSSGTIVIDHAANSNNSINIGGLENLTFNGGRLQYNYNATMTPLDGMLYVGDARVNFLGSLIIELTPSAGALPTSGSPIPLMEGSRVSLMDARFIGSEQGYLSIDGDTLRLTPQPVIQEVFTPCGTAFLYGTSATRRIASCQAARSSGIISNRDDLTLIYNVPSGDTPFIRITGTGASLAISGTGTIGSASGGAAGAAIRLDGESGTNPLFLSVSGNIRINNRASAGGTGARNHGVHVSSNAAANMDVSILPSNSQHVLTSLQGYAVLLEPAGGNVNLRIGVTTNGFYGSRVQTSGSTGDFTISLENSFADGTLASHSVGSSSASDSHFYAGAASSVNDWAGRVVIDIAPNVQIGRQARVVETGGYEFLAFKIDRNNHNDPNNPNLITNRGIVWGRVDSATAGFASAERVFNFGTHRAASFVLGGGDDIVENYGAMTVNISSDFGGGNDRFVSTGRVEFHSDSFGSFAQIRMDNLEEISLTGFVDFRYGFGSGGTNRPSPGAIVALGNVRADVRFPAAIIRLVVNSGSNIPTSGANVNLFSNNDIASADRSFLASPHGPIINSGNNDLILQPSGALSGTPICGATGGQILYGATGASSRHQLCSAAQSSGVTPGADIGFFYNAPDGATPFIRHTGRNGRIAIFAGSIVKSATNVNRGAAVGITGQPNSQDHLRLIVIGEDIRIVNEGSPTANDQMGTPGDTSDDETISTRGIDHAIRVSEGSVPGAPSRTDAQASPFTGNVTLTLQGRGNSLISNAADGTPAILASTGGAGAVTVSLGMDTRASGADSANLRAQSDRGRVRLDITGGTHTATGVHTRNDTAIISAFGFDSSPISMNIAAAATIGAAGDPTRQALYVSTENSADTEADRPTINNDGTIYGQVGMGSANNNANHLLFHNRQGATFIGSFAALTPPEITTNPASGALSVLAVPRIRTESGGGVQTTETVIFANPNSPAIQEGRQDIRNAGAMTLIGDSHLGSGRDSFDNLATGTLILDHVANTNIPAAFDADRTDYEAGEVFRLGSVVYQVDQGISAADLAAINALTSDPAPSQDGISTISPISFTSLQQFTLSGGTLRLHAAFGSGGADRPNVAPLNVRDAGVLFKQVIVQLSTPDGNSVPSGGAPIPLITGGNIGAAEIRGLASQYGTLSISGDTLQLNPFARLITPAPICNSLLYYGAHSPSSRAAICSEASASGIASAATPNFAILYNAPAGTTPFVRNAGAGGGGIVLVDGTITHTTNADDAHAISVTRDAGADAIFVISMTDQNIVNEGTSMRQSAIYLGAPAGDDISSFTGDVDVVITGGGSISTVGARGHAISASSGGGDISITLAKDTQTSGDLARNLLAATRGRGAINISITGGTHATSGSQDVAETPMNPPDPMNPSGQIDDNAANISAFSESGRITIDIASAAQIGASAADASRNAITIHSANDGTGTMRNTVSNRGRVYGTVNFISDSDLFHNVAPGRISELHPGGRFTGAFHTGLGDDEVRNAGFMDLVGTSDFGAGDGDLFHNVGTGRLSIDYAANSQITLQNLETFAFTGGSLRFRSAFGADGTTRPASPMLDIGDATPRLRGALLELALPADTQSGQIRRVSTHSRRVTYQRCVATPTLPGATMPNPNRRTCVDVSYTVSATTPLIEETSNTDATDPSIPDAVIEALNSNVIPTSGDPIPLITGTNIDSNTDLSLVGSRFGMPSISGNVLQLEPMPLLTETFSQCGTRLLYSNPATRRIVFCSSPVPGGLSSTMANLTIVHSADSRIAFIRQTGAGGSIIITRGEVIKDFFVSPNGSAVSVIRRSGTEPINIVADASVTIANHDSDTVNDFHGRNHGVMAGGLGYGGDITIDLPGDGTSRISTLGDQSYPVFVRSSGGTAATTTSITVGRDTFTSGENADNVRIFGNNGPMTINITGGTHIATGAQTNTNTANLTILGFAGRPVINISAGATIGRADDPTYRAILIDSEATATADDARPLLDNSGVVYGAIRLTAFNATANNLLFRNRRGARFTGFIEGHGGGESVINDGVMTLAANSNFGGGTDAITNRGRINIVAPSALHAAFDADATYAAEGVFRIGNAVFQLDSGISTTDLAAINALTSAPTSAPTGTTEISAISIAGLSSFTMEASSITSPTDSTDMDATLSSSGELRFRFDQSAALPTVALLNIGSASLSFTSGRITLEGTGGTRLPTSGTLPLITGSGITSSLNIANLMTDFGILSISGNTIQLAMSGGPALIFCGALPVTRNPLTPPSAATTEVSCEGDQSQGIETTAGAADNLAILYTDAVTTQAPFIRHNAEGGEISISAGSVILPASSDNGDAVLLDGGDGLENLFVSLTGAANVRNLNPGSAENDAIQIRSLSIADMEVIARGAGMLTAELGRAIYAEAASGDITLRIARSASTAGDALFQTVGGSNFGDVSINIEGGTHTTSSSSSSASLIDIGTTSSGWSGRVAVNISASATLNIGAGGNAINVSGNTNRRSGADRNEIVNAGIINGVMRLAGSAHYNISNSGAFMGSMVFDSGDNAVSNSGIMRLTASPNFGTGTDTLTNTGTLTIDYNANGDTRLNLQGLETFNLMSGTLNFIIDASPLPTEALLDIGGATASFGAAQIELTPSPGSGELPDTGTLTLIQGTGLAGITMSDVADLSSAFGDISIGAGGVIQLSLQTRMICGNSPRPRVPRSPSVAETEVACSAPQANGVRLSGARLAFIYTAAAGATPLISHSGAGGEIHIQAGTIGNSITPAGEAAITMRQGGDYGRVNIAAGATVMHGGSAAGSHAVRFNMTNATGRADIDIAGRASAVGENSAAVYLQSAGTGDLNIRVAQSGSVCAGAFNAGICAQPETSPDMLHAIRIQRASNMTGNTTIQNDGVIVGNIHFISDSDRLTFNNDGDFTGTITKTAGATLTINNTSANTFFLNADLNLGMGDSFNNRQGARLVLRDGARIIGGALTMSADAVIQIILPENYDTSMPVIASDTQVVLPASARIDFTGSTIGISNIMLFSSAAQPAGGIIAANLIGAIINPDMTLTTAAAISAASLQTYDALLQSAWHSDRALMRQMLSAECDTAQSGGICSWGRVGGRITEHHPRASVRYDEDSYALIVGGHWASRSWRMVMALGYEGSEFDVRSSEAREPQFDAEGDRFLFGVGIGTKNMARTRGMDLDMQIRIGYTSYEANRRTDNLAAPSKGEPELTTLSAALGMERGFSSRERRARWGEGVSFYETWRVVPRLELGIFYMNADRFTESGGSAPFMVEAVTETLGFARTAFEARYASETRAGAFSGWMRGGVDLFLADPRSDLRATTMGNRSFTTRGSMESAIFDLGLGMGYNPIQDMELNLGYEGSFSVDGDTIIHSLSGRFNYNF